eukprot:scaffold12884_cov111-Isochrysis_galbana.AAC.12
MTPSAQRSAVWSYGRSCTSSGAMYRGVPLMDATTVVCCDMARANPKSHSMTRELAPMRTFCGFMSRWITRCECR